MGPHHSFKEYAQKVYFLYENCAKPYAFLRFISFHSVKSVRVRSYSCPYVPAFALNTNRYSVSLRIQFESGKYQRLNVHHL